LRAKEKSVFEPIKHPPVRRPQHRSDIIISKEYGGDSMYDPSDLKSLWVAVLNQAIEDITHPRGGKANTNAHARHRAIAWVKARGSGQQSFLWVCDHLGLDPENTRARILGLPRVPI
jgi:hypothetical protein